MMVGESLTMMVGGILRRDGRVLLCFRGRHRASYPGVWDLPGGHLRAAESPARAITRELEEELGIRARVPGGRAWLTRRERGIELSVFVVDEWQGDPVNRAPEEHDEIRWVSIAELGRLDLAHPAYVELLTQALQEAASKGRRWPWLLRQPIRTRRLLSPGVVREAQDMLD